MSELATYVELRDRARSMKELSESAANLPYPRWHLLTGASAITQLLDAIESKDKEISDLKADLLKKTEALRELVVICSEHGWELLPIQRNGEVALSVEGAHKGFYNAPALADLTVLEGE